MVHESIAWVQKFPLGLKVPGFTTGEAVKTVSDLFCPVSGEVTEFNGDLDDAPDAVNRDPYGEGWIIRVAMSDPAQVDGLLSVDQYKELIG